MTLYDYEQSKALAQADVPFYALIMAAMRGADSLNAAKLKACWPDVWDEFEARYWAPGGQLAGDGGEGIVIDQLSERSFDDIIAGHEAELRRAAEALNPVVERPHPADWEPAPDAHLEADYEDRNGGEVDG